MYSTPYGDGDSTACVFGGMIGTILVTMHSTDPADTMILATIGAIVSFSVTRAMKWFVGLFRK